MSDEAVVSDDEVVVDPLPPPPPPSREWTMSVAVGIMQLAGLASIGAGAIHAGVAGLHADNTTLARLFVAVAVAQLGVGLLALVKGGRLAAVVDRSRQPRCGGGLGSDAAVGHQLDRRLGGCRGPAVHRYRLRHARCDRRRRGARRARSRSHHGVDVRLGLPAFAVGVVTLAAMLVGTNHSHSPTAGDAHTHDEQAAAPVAEAAAVVDWPRPYDPTAPVDFSDVEGVTPEQQLRATALVRSTQEQLPAFADVDTLDELGYQSIGDARTGYEHYINYSLINDDVWLDPTQPESLVFRVDGDDRTLVSAMFIVGQRPIDDPELVDYGGRLMQWHVHENLCWRGGDDGPQVAGVTDDAGNCPAGTVARRRREPDDPRVDRGPRVRSVRRPRGARCRAGRRGGRDPNRSVRPRRRTQPRW